MNDWFKLASIHRLATEGRWEKAWNHWSDPSIWGDFLFGTFKIIVIILLGRLIMKIAQKALTHMLIERERRPLSFDVRRTKTIGKLLGNVVAYTVNFIMILLILSELGINLGPILAGAGVLGLAIGFGAQSLVKDVITGFFIIFEDQFGVGDVIQTGTFKGTVEEIGLRVTRIRTWTGEVHIIPNGSILNVTNFSVHNSVAVVDLPIAYETDVDEAVQVLNETLERSYSELDQVLKQPEVLGVQSISVTEVVLRVTAECKPNAQGAVERKLKKLLKEALEQHGIDIPYRQMVRVERQAKAE